MRSLKQANPKDIELIPEKINSVSTVWVIILFTGGCVYSSAIQMGNVFGVGLPVALILSIFFSLLVWYGMWMLRCAIGEARKDNSAAIWKKLAGKYEFIPCALIAVACAGNIIYLYYMIHQFFSLFISLVSPIQTPSQSYSLPALISMNHPKSKNEISIIQSNSFLYQKFTDQAAKISDKSITTSYSEKTKMTIREFFTDYFIVSFLASLIVLPGVLMKQDVRYFSVIALIKIFVVALMIIFELYNLIETGISPEVATLSASFNGIIASLDTLMTVFALTIFYFPIIGQLKNLTLNRIDKVNRWSIASIAFIDILFGVLQHLDQGPNYTSGFIFSMYQPGSRIQIIMVFLSLILSLLTLPMMFYPMIQVILGAVYVIYPFPSETWCLTGLGVSIICIFLGKLDINAFLILFFIVGFFSAILSYLFPVMYYFSAVKNPPIIHIIGCICMILMFILYCFAHISNFFGFFL
ncbi:hypothetical protein TRFO_29515 [Tritrichomonas foetus]|uniref:Transmembrane amino acid transporter protein n=1 Tax=Tritrichomonas foetus TaxID=1144522 RepID=A0A1J4K0A3_9EUKA|nr:hypothetical protein TRFO_29515 [Tritrichomonas foetus]|eukprot:OHT03204.1 hypothetical protein TRFO_29515 [Tritrichomonas foetus]